MAQVCMVKSSGPAGGLGWWWSRRCRFCVRGQAPLCEAACPCELSQGGQLGGSGALALCCSPVEPRMGISLSRWSGSPDPGRRDLGDSPVAKGGVKGRQ